MTRLSRPLLLLLAGISALGSLAIHMFVPAMPAAARDLAASPATVQLAVSLYLLGLGGGQLIAGPISDAIGRKPVLLVGATIFVAGSIGAALAPSAPILLAARLVEAGGAAASMIAARALVSDLSERGEAAANIAALTSAVLLSPTIAPSIGGALVSLAGWRFVFTTLAVAGTAALLACAWLVPAHAPQAVRARLDHAYARLARNARFRRFVAGNALASSSFYIFLGGSPFLLIGQWHLSPSQAGLCYLVVAGSAMAGTFAVRRIDRRRNAFRIGLAMISGGGAAMLAVALLGGSGPVALVLPMLVVGFGGGIAAPTGIAGAMHAEEGMAGTASSLAGAIQMIASAAVTALMSRFGATSILPLAAAIFATGTIAMLLAPGREAEAR